MSKYWDIILSRFFDRPVFRQLSKHWEFSNFPVFRQPDISTTVETLGCRNTELSKQRDVANINIKSQGKQEHRTLG